MATNYQTYWDPAKGQYYYLQDNGVTSNAWTNGGNNTTRVYIGAANPSSTTTNGTTAAGGTYRTDPYDWKSLLSYYQSPASMDTLYQVQDPIPTPQYGYEYTQLRAKSGNPVMPRYNVANPANPTSATAAQILADYNLRNNKSETALTDAILSNYITNYNKANNIAALTSKNYNTLNTLDQSIQDAAAADATLAAWLANNPTAKQSKIDEQMLAAANRAISAYNLANDTNAAAQQGIILGEFNTDRTNQQNTYNQAVQDYNTLVEDVRANPQQYYKPVEQYQQPVVQNAYYNKFAQNPANTSGGTVAAAHGGYIHGYANGGMVQPQVQDLLQQYNTPLQQISPLNALRGSK